MFEPKPASSIRISSTFGAPCGGEMVGGQLGVLLTRFGLISPVKGGVGIGSTRELGNSRVPGAPGWPWSTWAVAGSAGSRAPARNNTRVIAMRAIVIVLASSSVEMVHERNGVVGHCGNRVPEPRRLALAGVDRRRVAAQVRLPLAGMTAAAAVEVRKAHAE